jgi:hypothetical protein
MRPLLGSMVANAPAKARAQRERTVHHVRTEQCARMMGLRAVTDVKPPRAVVAGGVAPKARRAACRDVRWHRPARGAPAAPVMHRRDIQITVRARTRRRRMVQTMRPIRLGTARGPSGMRLATPVLVQAPMRAAAIRVGI